MIRALQSYGLVVKPLSQIIVKTRRSRDQYTHFGKVFELTDRRFAVHRPTQKCLVGPNHNLLRARTGKATGQENGPRREHDGGMEERRGGDGESSSVPGA